MAKPTPAILALLLVVASSRAQTFPDVQIFAGAPGTGSSSSCCEVVDLGDLDGDLIDDFGVAGLSFVHHSTTNFATPLQDIVFPGLVRGAYRIIALPDLDGDGFPDFAYIMLNTFLGNPTTLMYIASGLTTATVATIPLPSATSFAPQSIRIAAIGDRNGDGTTDYVLTYVSRVSELPLILDSRIDTVDGTTFTPAPFLTFPNVALPSGGLFLVGDVDGDGIGDFVSGSPLTSALVGHGGSTSVFSGATGAGIRNWLGQTASEQLGATIVPLDDIDGDGLLDVASFAPGAAPAGRVWFFSPGSGLAVGSITPPAGDELRALFAAGDMDGDGFRDLVIELWDPVQFAAHRELRSGTSGEFITSLPASVYPVGDVNGDGLSDALEIVPVSTGGVVVPTFHRRTLIGAQSYGSGVGGRQLAWQPSPSTPATGILRFSGAASFAPLFAAVSLQPAATTIAGTPFPLLISNAPNDLVATFNHVADGVGEHVDFIDLRIPALGGLVFYLQFAELGANPGTSNAVEMMFGPQY
ncbi:MAG: FG-GAP-like repeat-containing protein [Planctomycetota bacterium]